MNKKKILVADDDPGILEAIKYMLEDAGYEVVTTKDGEDIYKMEKGYPDLLLLDIWMSGQDGSVICKFLKSREATKNIPVIMVSANKDAESIAKDAGADGFIKKPFEMNELLKIVAQYTGTKN